MLGGISPVQLVIVLVIVVLIFGTKKLRGMGKDIGGAVKGFKEGMNEKSESPEANQEPLLKQDESSADDLTAQKKQDSQKQDN